MDFNDIKMMLKKHQLPYTTLASLAKGDCRSAIKHKDEAPVPVPFNEGQVCVIEDIDAIGIGLGNLDEMLVFFGERINLKDFQSAINNL